MLFQWPEFIRFLEERNNKILSLQPFVEKEKILQEEIAHLKNEFDKASTNKKQAMLEESKAGFEQFMNGWGFTVIAKEYKIEATYKSLDDTKISLIYDANLDFMIEWINLDASITNKYVIAPSAAFEYKYKLNAPWPIRKEWEIKTAREAIADLESDIEMCKERLKHIADVELVYKTDRKEFEKIYEVMIGLFDFSKG